MQRWSFKLGVNYERNMVNIIYHGYNMNIEFIQMARLTRFNNLPCAHRKLRC